MSGVTKLVKQVIKNGSNSNYLHLSIYKLAPSQSAPTILLLKTFLWFKRHLILLLQLHMIDFIYYVGGHGALNLFDMIPIFLYMIFAGQQCKTEFIPHLRPIFL